MTIAEIIADLQTWVTEHPERLKDCSRIAFIIKQLELIVE